MARSVGCPDNRVGGGRGHVRVRVPIGSAGRSNPTGPGASKLFERGVLLGRRRKKGVQLGGSPVENGRVLLELVGGESPSSEKPSKRAGSNEPCRCSAVSTAWSSTLRSSAEFNFFADAQTSCAASFRRFGRSVTLVDVVRGHEHCRLRLERRGDLVRLRNAVVGLTRGADRRNLIDLDSGRQDRIDLGGCAALRNRTADAGARASKSNRGRAPPRSRRSLPPRRAAPLLPRSRRSLPLRRAALLLPRSRRSQPLRRAAFLWSSQSGASSLSSRWKRSLACGYPPMSRPPLSAVCSEA